MLKQNIRPTSVVGIKRLANTLKGERNIPHHEALDEAARIAGFENFRHAGNKLSQYGAKLAAPLTHRVYISAFWKDRKSGLQGREITWVDLSSKWADLVTTAQMQLHRALMDLFPEAEDHLSHRYTLSSQSEARRDACATVRTFQFIDATKLRPSKAHSRVYPGGRSSNAIPGRDHYSSWYDAVSKGYIFVDEPYEPAALARVKERSAWAEKHDYAVAKPSWPGMYNPGGIGGSRLYLIAHRKNVPSLEALKVSLDRLPAPMIEETWVGESTTGFARYRSPAELRQASAPLPPESVTVSQLPRPISSRTPQAPRPGRMSIELHEEIGRKLKSVSADTARRDGVYKRLGIVRGELDDWIQREYTPIDLPMDRFSEVYYGSGPRETFSRSLASDQIARHVQTLESVKMEIEL